jgi:hypothetical protein
MKRLVSIALLILVLMSLVSARMPQKGDMVRISMIDYGHTILDGKITDIGNGLICMNCTTGRSGDKDLGVPLDICIGTGQITTLIWI